MTDSSIVDSDSGCFDRKTLNPEEFARLVRQLAVDTHHCLSRSNTTMCEFISLRRRFGDLLGENQERQHTEVERWLRNARRTLEARLLASSTNSFSTSRAYSWSTSR